MTLRGLSEVMEAIKASMASLMSLRCVVVSGLLRLRVTVFLTNVGNVVSIATGFCFEIRKRMETAS